VEAVVPGEATSTVAAVVPGEATSTVAAVVPSEATSRWRLWFQVRERGREAVEERERKREK
jgi:hypothetical protein